MDIVRNQIMKENPTHKDDLSDLGKMMGHKCLDLEQKQKSPGLLGGRETKRKGLLPVINFLTMNFLFSFRDIIGSNRPQSFKVASSPRSLRPYHHLPLNMTHYSLMHTPDGRLPRRHISFRAVAASPECSPTSGAAPLSSAPPLPSTSWSLLFIALSLSTSYQP